MVAARASPPRPGRPLATAAAVAAVLGLSPACEEVKLQVLAPVPSASASSAAAATCAPPGVALCEAQLEQECRDAKQCCSGACLLAEDEKKRCARVTSCASFCEDCSVPADCCSGRCEDDGSGRTVCWSGTCRAQGELCSDDADCCSEAGPVRCVEDPVGLKSKRCRLDSSGPPCVGDGARCATAADCCGGFCIGGGRPEPVCASACVPDGGACTTAADCCSSAATCEGEEDGLVCTLVVR